MPKSYWGRHHIVGSEVVNMPTKLVLIEDHRCVENLWNRVDPYALLEHPAPLHEIPIFRQSFQKFLRAPGEISGKDRVIFGDRNRLPLLDDFPPQSKMRHSATQITGGVDAILGYHPLAYKFLPVERPAIDGAEPFDIGQVRVAPVKFGQAGGSAIEIDDMNRQGAR